jgi:hypothetical protein
MKFPHCDLSTGKIYGCKKNSKLWFHEKGHLVFNSLESTSSLKLLQDYVFKVWMLSMTLSIINVYMLLISLPAMLFYIGIEVYEEIWCNRYAEMKFNKNVKK